MVVGGTSGIGKDVARIFSEKQNTVICLGRSANVEKGEIVCDVTDEKSVTKAFREIGERCGIIDLLVNAAGYAVNGVSELTPVADVKKQFDVNYFGLLSCCHAALPLMGKGSKIVNISSACAIFPLPFRAHYCASKAAVNMLSHGMRMELKGTGIDVTAICPGDVQTNFVKTRVKNVATNEKYGKRAENFFEHIENDTREGKRMTVEYVSNKIYKICMKKRTKPCIVIGTKYKGFAFLTKVFPLGWILAVLNKMFGGWK